MISNCNLIFCDSYFLTGVQYLSKNNCRQKYDAIPYSIVHLRWRIRIAHLDGIKTLRLIIMQRYGNAVRFSCYSSVPIFSFCFINFRSLHTHTHTHTHRHTHTHTVMYTPHTHTHTHTVTHIHSHTQSHTHTHSHTHTQSHTQSHTHTHTHTHSHTYIHTYSVCMYVCVCDYMIQSHIQSHERTYKHTHTIK